MKRAQNSDSETHVENLNQTSRTDLSRKSLSYIFLGHPVFLEKGHMKLFAIFRESLSAGAKWLASLIIDIILTKNNMYSYYPEP